MTPNEYQKEALRTEQPTHLIHKNFYFIFARGSAKDRETIIKAEEDVVNQSRLVNGLMGLNGEAGEAIDILKKHLFHGHDLDREHLAKELGDVAWYLAVSADALGYSLEEILKMNVNKLRKRYPEGFDKERSVNREEGDI